MKDERRTAAHFLFIGGNVLRIFLWTCCILLILVILSTAGGIYYVNAQLQPPALSEQTIEFTIEPGTNSREISNLLEQVGMIRNGQIFYYYLRWNDQGSRFQAGEYSMTPGIALNEVIERLNTGDVVPIEIIRFTIPEGYTARQTMTTLMQLGYSQEDLEALLNQTIPLEMSASSQMSKWIAEKPDHGQYRMKLEGYLFPETYEFPNEVTAAEVIERMVLELERKLKSLPADWEQQLSARGLTFHEMLTIASLIEREVVVDHERALVAGVIYNRIEQNMYLQIDATVQYLFDEPKERLLESDLKIESPYNTYLNPGIPPGPIASPGIASIRAALYPEPSDYLFYVTKKDGTGEHYFAKTYKEHLNNIKISKAQ